MDLGIKGCKAIVCASSQGLGLACATSLAREGCMVFINGRDESRLETAVAEIQAATGVRATPVAASQPSQIYATYAYVWAKCYEAYSLVELGDLRSAAVLADEALKVAEALGMALTLSGALEVSVIVYMRNGNLDRTSTLMAHLQRILLTTDVDLGSYTFPKATVDYSMRNLTEAPRHGDANVRQNGNGVLARKRRAGAGAPGARRRALSRTRPATH
jgi:hypothetical protein